MASVDNRVVRMVFDNAAFQKGVSGTLSALDNLKRGLGNLSGAAKGLGDFKVNSQGLAPLGQGVDTLVTKFSALQVAGVTAIANIANQAMNAGKNIANSLTVAPISGGLGEYEKKLGSIQTIMANTAAAGTTLDQVSGALNELNTYSDQTIYNFGEMARNIGTFTAAGVSLETSVASIKGLSNLAALSGSTSEQASTAMYQLSQEISAGRVSLLGWNSVVNAGMGGSVFQRSLAETAVAMGKLPESALKLEGAMKNVKVNGQSFRDSISGDNGPSWLTSDVLTTALGNFTGDMTKAQIVAQGFSEAQADAIIAQGELATSAATKVKTASQLMGTLKETAESGWAQTWELILGDFTEAPLMFTKINDTIGGFISRTADARNAMLAVWKADGGRDALINGFGNAAKALFSILKPIGEAWRSIFPATTGKQLADMTRSFEQFTKGLILGEENMNNLKRTFQGIFAVIQIVWSVFKGVAGAIFDLVGATSAGGGGFLAITAIIGDFLSGIARIITFKDPIGAFFDALVSPLALLGPFVALVVNLTRAFSNLLSGDINTEQFMNLFTRAFSIFGGTFDQVTDKVKGFYTAVSDTFGSAATFLEAMARRFTDAGNTMGAGIIGGLSAAANFLQGFFLDAGGTLSKLADDITSTTDKGKTFLSGFGGTGLEAIKAIISLINEKLQELREKLDFSGPFEKFNSGASQAASGGVSTLSGVISVATTIWNTIKSIFGGIGDFLGPFLSEVGALFTTIVSKLREWFGSMDMVDFVALVNTGVLLLMFRKISGFMKSGRGMFDNIGEAFGNLTGVLGKMQAAIKANIIMQIAIAVGVMVAALFILAKIDGDALKTALIALAVVFAQIAAMMKIITMIDPTSMIGAGLGMIALATAIVILAGAIKILGEMDPDVLKQGAIALGVLMVALAAMTTVLSGTKGIFVAAAGLLLLAAAMTAMAGAIVLYAQIPFAVLEKGILSMGAALLVLGIAMQAFPKGMVMKAAGIAILAAALVVLTGALTALGMLPMGVIVQGIVAMAISLGILALAARAMSGALPGAAAMFVMAAAIAVLAPALALMGALPMEVIAKGLLAIAGIMVIFVAGMYLLAPVIVVLALFSSSILTLGLAMLAAGAGFALFVGALGLLTVVGAAGFAVLVVGIQSVLMLLPLLAQQFGYAVIAFFKVLEAAAPRVASSIGAIIMAFINEIAKRIPEIAAAGLDMIIGLLTAIRDRIGDITTIVIDIFANFLNAVKSRLPAIIQMGLDFILSFMEGLAAAVRGEKERTGEAGADLAMALIEGIISGLKSLGGMVGPKLVEIGTSMVKAFKGFFGINSPSTVFAGFGRNIVEGLINGIGGMIGNLAGKAKELGGRAISAAKEGFSDAVAAGAVFVTKLVTGVGNAAGSLSGKAREAVSNAVSAARNAIGDAASIGRAIVDGMVRGISNGLSAVTTAAKNLAKGALDSAKNFLGIKSPSVEFQKIGEYANQGFVKGLTSGTRESSFAAYNQMKDTLAAAMDAATRSIEYHERGLASLLSATNRNEQAIRDHVNQIAVSREELRKTSEAHRLLTGDLKNHQRSIHLLSDEYVTLGPKLEEAQKILTDAIKTRDDYAKSTAAQYGKLNEVTPESGVTDYVEGVRKKAQETQKFATLLQRLRSMGLNDESYQDLLAKGLDALPFVEKLAALGMGSVQELNKVSAQLDKEAGRLGTMASRALYQAGVNSAQGMVNGITSRQSQIVREMEYLANIMLTTIKRTLGIQSPSREMAKLGGFAAKGMARGIKAGVGEIKSASEFMADTSLRAMKSTMERLSDGLSAEMDLNPTIAPVLDLTDIKREADKIGAALDKQAITVGAAYSGAVAASASYNRNLSARAESDAQPAAEPVHLEFKQTNISPKALSPAEIYRNTKNQLSVARGVLDSNATSH